MADTTSAAPSAAEFALRALVAAGHVSQELVDQALALPGAPQPVVREPLTDEQAMELVSAAMQQHGITLTGHGVAFAVDVAKRAHGIA